MAWFMVGIAVASTVISGVSAREQANSQIEASRQAQIASKSATEQAQIETLRNKDIDILNEKRRASREGATAVATQANSGIGGITAKRQINNILFQSVLNEDSIKKAAEEKLYNIGAQDFSNSSSIKANENKARAKKPSWGSIAFQGASKGASTFVIAGKEG